MLPKKKNKKFVESESEAKPVRLIAKKDFAIVYNDYKRLIKVGDDLSDVPEMFLPNLEIEGVI